METMFMQNFGGTNKEYYGIFESGLLDRTTALTTHTPLQPPYLTYGAPPKP